MENLEGEIWKEFPYKGFPKYKVSNYGRVFSEKSGDVLKLVTHHKGYLKTQIYYMGKTKGFFVHRLVALAFIENPNDYSQVNHINGIKSDNSVGNLEWCSQSMNMKHARTNGLMNSPKGEDHYFARLKNEDVLSIRKLFKEGHTRRMLAKQYNCKPSNIKDIIMRRSWRHI